MMRMEPEDCEIPAIFYRRRKRRIRRKCLCVPDRLGKALGAVASRLLYPA
jgi:membrane glycosyltransferase